MFYFFIANFNKFLEINQYFEISVGAKTKETEVKKLTLLSQDKFLKHIRFRIYIFKIISTKIEKI